MIKKIFIISSIVIFAGILMMPNFNSVIAATPAELQAQINALMTQVKQLQQQLEQTQTSSSIRWCHNFNTNLKFGDSGDEVSNLHLALKKEGFIVNNEEQSKTYFGESTASNVSGFQQKYASEILTPLGLKYGTGYVGKATRAKLNSLYGCLSTTTTTPAAPTTTTAAPTTTTDNKEISCSVNSDDGFVTYTGYVRHDNDGYHYRAVVDVGGNDPCHQDSGWQNKSPVQSGHACPSLLNGDATKSFMTTFVTKTDTGIKTEGTENRNGQNLKKTCTANFLSEVIDDINNTPAQQISCNAKSDDGFATYTGYAKHDKEGYKYRAVLDVASPSEPRCHMDTDWKTQPPTTGTHCTSALGNWSNIKYVISLFVTKTDTGILTEGTEWTGGMGLKKTCTSGWTSTSPN